MCPHGMLRKDALETLKVGRKKMWNLCIIDGTHQCKSLLMKPLGKIFGGIDSVSVAFGENFPLSMDFTFSDGSGSVKYFLAPRVEQDGF